MLLDGRYSVFRAIPLCLAVTGWMTSSMAAPARVVVYGATAAGVMTAISAKKEGISVILIEPGRHVGGMVTGGLGRTDMDRQSHLIGGMTREFFQRVGRQYGTEIAWFFEPKVAEKVMRGWLAEEGVSLVLGEPLKSIRKEGSRIAALETESGRVYEGRIFVDATYEGDLLKAAGVSYAVGREGRQKFGERFAGRQDFLPGYHQLRVATSALDDDGKILPGLVPEEAVVGTGEGDGKIQAFCFRLCLTSNPENRIPIGIPNGYDPKRYGLVKNYIRALGDRATIGDFLGISRMPNDKTDVNAGGGVSTNLPGASLAYIEAPPAERKRIWEEHRSWAHGLLYFLGHDESVPEGLRRQVLEWGLPKDEFTDTGHWPHQMYIREARRMVGEYVLTEHDLLQSTSKYDSVGMAQYNIDIREIQWVAKTVSRFPEVAQEVLMEGYVSMKVKPYQIPFRSMLPRQSECSNLIVPVNISSSHVAFASYRMEPQYMISGESAGVAAATAINAGVPVHHVDLALLQKKLKQRKQIIEPADAQPVQGGEAARITTSRRP